MPVRAQVFISCGQREDLGEIQIVDKIASVIANEGFEPYVAAKQQTLRGLKENIYDRLAESEYLLFIDFRREQLSGSQPLMYRGSVFSQQELAVAAHHDIEVIAFQEEGVKSLEGILEFMQANCMKFSDRSELPAKIVDAIRVRGWSADWRNRLTIDSSVSVDRNVLRLPEQIQGDFYHLIVRNNHRSKTARNVYGYLDSVMEAETGASVVFEAAEFKWAGYTLPNATIPAKKARKLDALWIPYPIPNTPQFNVFTDSTRFVPTLNGPGKWLLKYSVICDTLPGDSRTFVLSLDGTAQGVRFDAVLG